MSVEHGTLEAFGVIFVGWATVFFGIWAMPISLTYQIAIDIFSSIAFIIFGAAYFSHKQIIHVRKQRVLFWFGVCFASLFAGMNFGITMVTWETISINDVPVVTYRNVFSLMFSVVGIVEVLIALWLIRMDYRRRKMKNKESANTIRK
jgi:NADH:ubiquinone oxidoreductase subunit K